MFTFEFTNPDDISLLPELLRKRVFFPMEDEKAEVRTSKDVIFDSNVPMDNYFDKDGNEYYAFGLAGIPETCIEVLKKGNLIIVSVKDLEATNDDIEYEVHELLDENGRVAEIEIDEENFKSEPIVIYKNGMLVLKFSIKEEEKAKSIKIKKVD